ncbi:MAG: hypothetical protein Q4D38_08660 [Planctomycetia bacterium]|nr:hypothetical protein [Planctomycetia bacterium]
MGKSQALPIALILFVIIAIALGITTYLFKKQADEAILKENAVAQENAKLQQEVQQKTDDIVVLKRLIGFADAGMEEIETKVQAQMSEVAVKENPTYYTLISELQEKFVEAMKKSEEFEQQLVQVKTEMEKLRVDTAERIDVAEAEAKKAREQLESHGSAYATATTQMEESYQKMKTTTDSVVKKTQSEKKKAEENTEKAMSIIDDKQEQLDNMRRVIEESALPPQENPMGQIIFVNPRGNQGIINLGKADRLTRSLTFSVYEPKDMSEQGKKGTIEVIDVFDTRKAEVRIFNNDESNPIEEGDVIYTPTWSPGFQERFAIVGFIDIDDDGVSDLDTVLSLIRRNGGLIDAHQMENGLQSGKITSRTSWIVYGIAPDEKSSDDMRSTYTNFTNEAKKFNTKGMQIGELLRKMGYRPPAKARELSVRPETGTAGRSSTGSVSGLYQEDGKSSTPRRPPARSAY